MGLEGLSVQTAEGLADVTCEETEEGMRFTSANPAGQMQDILLRREMETVYGHYYEMVYRFASNTAGTVRFSGEGAAYYESNEFEVKEGENEIIVRFAAGKAESGKSLLCLELGGLGAFRLTFTGISLVETDAPHTHSFVNGKCECGETNGFAGVSVWTEGSLTPVTREDTESSMTVVSTNAPGDWWKVKLEWPLAVTEGKTYDVTFHFTSDVAGTIKYSVNSAAYLTANEYAVQSGANTFTVRFAAGTENYSCLELGGLGAFRLTFTGLGIQETS